MKRIILFLALAAIIGLGSYVLGFRHGAALAAFAAAPVRGSIAAAELDDLDRGNPDRVRVFLESDVDNGLIWWAELERFPLHRPLVEVVWGQAFEPFERNVRRTAAYRKTHASPIMKPQVIAKMLQQVRANDPEFASYLESNDQGAEANIALMIKKYAE